jgi:multicomponent Na+:H+ antiporter subunit E
MNGTRLWRRPGWTRHWRPGTLAVRIAGFALLWLLLVEGNLRYTGMALLAILAAAVASMALSPVTGARWSLAGVARFTRYFVWQSIAGGFDVALRALSPAMPLDPGFVEFRLRLREEAARVLLANTMSLMPGTLSVELRGRMLRLHVLDRSTPVAALLRATERRVADLFGTQLAEDDDAEEPADLARPPDAGR